MTRIFTLVALVFMAGLTAVAQTTFTKGYVVMASGDTIRGEIKHNPKKEFAQFSKVTIKLSETETKTLKAEKVKLYSYGATTFISRLVDGEQVFMKRISEGAIDLYEWQYEAYRGNEVVIRSDFYLEKEGEAEPVRVKEGKFTKQVAEIMSDNEDIVKELEEKKYNYENISEVVDNYNQWAKQKS
jgi:hypothetical protein